MSQPTQEPRYASGETCYVEADNLICIDPQSALAAAASRNAPAGARVDV